MTIQQIKEIQAVQRREAQVNSALKTKRTVWVQLLQDIENTTKWYVLKYYKNGRHYTVKQYVGCNPTMPKAIRVHVDTAHKLLSSCQFI